MLTSIEYVHLSGLRQEIDHIEVNELNHFPDVAKAYDYLKKRVSELEKKLNEKR